MPHVHVHILPRKWTDFEGNNDKVYPELERNEVELHKKQREEIKVDDEAREPRTPEEMETEANWLKTYFPEKSD